MCKDRSFRRFFPYKESWTLLDAIEALWDQLKESAIPSMDRTSGLSLMALFNVVKLKDWQTVLLECGWLDSYLHLLFETEVVQPLAGSKPFYFVQVWWDCLPFDRYAVSALRATLSSARHEHDGRVFKLFLNNIGHYIEVSRRQPFFCLHWRLAHGIF